MRATGTGLPRLFAIGNELLDPKVFKALPTHEILTRLGFVSHPKPGLVHWLPVGMLVLQKITSLVHRHMQATGAERVHLSALSHSLLWQKTGRWDGKELFKVNDQTGGEYCLAPTCEEEITQLVKDRATSYRSYPLAFYQISTKFRDEKRPRSGLLRGREFIMKDAYTFDVSEQDAMETYERMVQAYHSIFTELGVPYVQAEADSGEIGGSLSHEWQYEDESGEDTLFRCDLCGHLLNVEKTLSFPDAPLSVPDVAVQYFVTTDESTLICAYYPGSRKLNPGFLRHDIPDVDLNTPLSQSQILELFSDEDLLVDKRVVRVMDARLDLRLSFPDFPIKFVNRSLITTLTDIPLVEAQDGDVCAECEDGHLHPTRAIEVGHTFYLGDKYTRALGLTVEQPGRTPENVLMGCYGIGISRIVAAIAQIKRDDKGIDWPAKIAPWEATVVTPDRDISNAMKVVELLQTAGIDCRIDDRNKLHLGRKLKDALMVGIPLVVIVGREYPNVEIETRAGEKTIVSADDAPSTIRKLLDQK